MFELRVHASADALKAIKAELTLKMPEVKSSHRCEAIARGLGFGTYAAALAACKTEEIGIVQVKGDLFNVYLSGHNFDVQPKLLYDAVARVALRDVSRRVPRLTMWGFGVGQPKRKEDGQWESVDDMNIRFRQSRAEFLSDGAVEAFLSALALLRRVKPMKTIRQDTNSYWLKHIAENFASSYPEGEKLGPVYVPNGVFIAAALHLGFRIRTYTDELGYDNLNVTFNISKRLLEDLDCEVRPEGPRAQDRRYRDQMRSNRYHPFGSATV